MAAKIENRMSEKGEGKQTHHSLAALNIFPRKIVRLALLSLIVGACSFAYKSYQADDYQSEARILLLAPQEQYLPSVAGTASLDQSVESQTELADKLIEDLKSPKVLSNIVDQLHLTQDKSFASNGALQTIGTMIRLGSLSVTPREAVIDRVQQSLSIERLAPRRVITISMKAPKADAAAKIANSLAEAYINLLSQTRRKDLNVSIDKLNGQIQSLSSQLKRGGDAGAGQALSGAVRSISLKKGAPESAEKHGLIEAQEKGRAQMVERLRVRQAELRTLSTLDLLPPAARLLVRATAAYTPVSKATYLWAFMSFGMMFLLGLIWHVGLLRMKNKATERSARQTNEPTLPQEVRLKFPRPVELPAMPSADIQMVQTRQAANSHAALPLEQKSNSRADVFFDLVAEQLSDVTHARIVLMAQDKAWGARGHALASRFVRERSVAYVNLISDSLGKSDNDGQAPYGIADLLDGNGSFSDFIDEEWNGKAKFINAGSRQLNRSDLLSSEFHALLIALEAAYDIVMLDLGTSCEDVSILRGFASVPDAIAFVIVPEIADAEVAQLHEAVGHLGFADSLIVTDLEFGDTSDKIDEEQASLLQAAE